MNWKKRYEGLQPGTKVRHLGGGGAACYKEGEIYTLRHCYIKDGVWTDYNVGDTSNAKDHWDTEEHPGMGFPINCIEAA